MGLPRLIIHLDIEVGEGDTIRGRKHVASPWLVLDDDVGNGLVGALPLLELVPPGDGAAAVCAGHVPGGVV